MDFPSSFICAGHEYADKIKNDPVFKPAPAPYLRRSFVLDKLPPRADLLITATGFYELHVNGRQINASKLAPYISNPDDLLFYDSYDLLPLLEPGENVIGIWLGNGFANNPGGCLWDFDKAVFRAAPAVAARLDMGETAIETDGSFKTAPSPVFFDDYRIGEHYDSRNETPGWASPGFDDGGWSAAQAVMRRPRGEAVLNAVDPIVVTEELAPVSVRQVEGGHLYDFGVNMSGACRLRIKGAPGQEIALCHGERLLPDGGLDLSNISYDIDSYHKDIFICGGGEDEWTPTFTYHGFRYVQVSGMTPAQATPEALTYLVFNTDLRERGGFCCSDEMANTLQTLTRRSTLSNFHHFPTDCPHREKNGWTADAALSAEHALLNLSPERNYRQWMHSIRKAQRDDGALPGIVPTTGWGFQWGNGPAWDSVLVWIPYYTYLYRGDKAILEENAHAILRYLEYLSTKTGADGLIAIGLGDWCEPRGVEHYKSPVKFTDTMMSMDICAKAAFIFGELGKPLHAAFAEGLRARLYAAAREKLVDAATLTALGECQTSQAMAIFYDLFTDAEKPAAFKRLLEIIHDGGDFMDTGVLGARAIFHVLAEYGEAGLAFKMITRPEFPSYGWWVTQGAISLWEGFIENSGLSLNHHFWGDISHWFIRRLAGIHYDVRAKRGAADIKPLFVPQLAFAEGFHVAPEGEIRVRWERAAAGGAAATATAAVSTCAVSTCTTAATATAATAAASAAYASAAGILLTVTMPEPIAGDIILPGGYRFEDDGAASKPCKSGKYHISPCLS